MSRVLPFLLSSALVWLAACTCGSSREASEDKAAGKREAKSKTLNLRKSNPIKPSTTPRNHYGAPFSLTKSRSLAAVLEEGPDPTVIVKVRGRVESVCERRGCWLILQDKGLQARIVTKDHAFSVPGNVVGRVAVAEGVLEQRTLSVEQARHLEEDRGGDPNAVVGPREEYVLTATAVRIKAKDSRKKKKKKKKRGKKKKKRETKNTVEPRL